MKRSSLWVVAIVLAASVARTALAEGVPCEPACQPGFLCSQGQCVSACNPPCGAGEQCTVNATCEPIPTPVPIQEQSGPYVVGPPPPGSPVPVAQGPAWSDTTQAAEETDRGLDKTRLAVAMMLGVGGTSEINTSGSDLVNEPGVTPGFSVVLDHVVGSHFALGAGMRFYGYRFADGVDRMKALDVFFAPRIRFSANIVDFYIAPNLGLAVDWPPGPGDRGLGLAFSLAGGLQVYVARAVALFVEGGVLSRVTVFNGVLLGENANLVQGVLNFGVAFVL